MRPLHGVFIGHRGERCGIYQFGKALSHLLSLDSRITWTDQECADGLDLREALESIRPDLTIFNAHPSTMAWLDPLDFSGLAGVTFGIQHGVSQKIADHLDSFFDFVICLDPTVIPRHPKAIRVPRFMPATPVVAGPTPDLFTIGSFGFATPGKGFDRLCKIVNAEFSEAAIRLNIPRHDNPDIVSERQLSDVVARCRAEVTNSNVRLQITHDFMDVDDTVRFLSENTINAFLYDDAPDNGISSCVDFALASGRPIALTKSSMFRHMGHLNPSLCIEDRSISDIASLGVAVLDSERRNALPGAAAAVWTDQIISAMERHSKAAATPDGRGFNKILDDRSRAAYTEALRKLANKAPEMISRKIERANIQQAFGLDVAERVIADVINPKILAAGSFEDTAVEALKRSGYRIDEADPNVNGMTLTDYYRAYPEKLGTYDLILSISVLEHVADDETFLRILREFLRPGGIAVLTVDFAERWRSGMTKPVVDHRLYTTAAIVDRLMGGLSDCALYDNPKWSEGSEDFEYEGSTYGFAGLVFRRLDRKSIERAEVLPVWRDMLEQAGSAATTVKRGDLMTEIKSFWNRLPSAQNVRKR